MFHKLNHDFEKMFQAKSNEKSLGKTTKMESSRSHKSWNFNQTVDINNSGRPL